MHDDAPHRKAPAALRKLQDSLRKFALSFPETIEEFPWGHSAMKVKGKAFVFLSLHDDEVSMSVKLPKSRDIAVELPFTEPTRYGLAKHGWVTAHLRPKEKPPLDLLKAWIDESYRAIAPKKLVAKLR